MILKIYSVYDSKVGAYMNPMFFRSNPEALRAFAAAVNDPQHNFHKWSADYVLFELGAWHDDSASIQMLSAPKSLAVGIEFLPSADNVRSLPGELTGS